MEYKRKEHWMKRLKKKKLSQIKPSNFLMFHCDAVTLLTFPFNILQHPENYLNKYFRADLKSSKIVAFLTKKKRLRYMVFYALQ